MYIIIGTMVQLKSGHLISVDGHLLPSVVWINDHIVSHIWGGQLVFDGLSQSHGLVSLERHGERSPSIN